MAIKGIEAQLMVTRTADYTKDASVMQRRNELMQDYLTAQQKVAEAQEKQRVLRTLESEDVRIRPDEGERGGAGGQQGAKKHNEKSGEDKPGMGAVGMPEERMIDIKI